MLGLRFSHVACMRSAGSPDVLEYRRCLAVQRVAEGYSLQEVADFLDVDSSSVRRWLAASRHGGEGLSARPVPGRPPKLTTTQEKIVRRWLSDRPTDHGFPTDLWSAPRLVQLIDREFGVRFHPNYLSTWLRQRGFTLQMPRCVAREHDDEAIARWLAEDWPRIKKKSSPSRRLPAADGRKRLADGPVAAAQLGPAGAAAATGAEGRAPGKGLGRRGAVAAAVAGPPASGLPDAGQRLLHQRGGRRVHRLRRGRAAGAGHRPVGWRHHAQGRSDPCPAGSVPRAIGHRTAAPQRAGVDAGGAAVGLVEVRAAV